MGIGSAAVALVLGVPAGAAAGEQLGNGSFESGLNGWSSWNGTLAQTSGASGSGARVAHAAGSSYSIYSYPYPVQSAAAGTVYHATAKVRSEAPGRTLCLVVRERGPMTTARACVTAGADWQSVPEVAYTTVGDGNTIEVYVQQTTAAAAGDSFDVDDVTLVAADATPPSTGTHVLAAGDVASCSSDGDSATAQILDAHPDATVTVLGDAVYESGTHAEFTDCYEPTWGRAKARTRPAVGNHEYRTAGAVGYFDYFGPAAGDRTKGYYSYDLAGWHVVVLNTNCAEVACHAGSPQEQWLRADLAASEAACTLAYGHHPRFTSGDHHGPATEIAPLWRALYDAGADLVFSSHQHVYERFAPVDPEGARDESYGLRSFVVGTGGKSLYSFGAIHPASEARFADAFGVLRLTLRADAYDWAFLPVGGAAARDEGSGACHGAPPVPSVPNVLGNGSFESGLTGWSSWNGSLSSTAGATGSGARVSRETGSSYSIYTYPYPVQSTVADTAYTAAAKVRSETPGRTVCLSVRERGPMTTARSCTTATGEWQTLTTAYTTRADGNKLEVYVQQITAAATGDSFDVDAVVLTSG